MLAKVLGGAGRTSLLQRALMGDTPLATAVRVRYADLAESGIFQIDITARSDASLSAIERIVDSVVASVAAAPLDEDLIRRAIADSMVASVAGLQLVKARADLLGEGALLHGEPAALLDGRSRFALTRAGEVMRAARAHLGDARAVLSMVPAGRLELVSRPELPFDNVTPRR
jgi:hypothetical protein